VEVLTAVICGTVFNVMLQTLTQTHTHTNTHTHKHTHTNTHTQTQTHVISKPLISAKLTILDRNKLLIYWEKDVTRVISSPT